MTVKIKLIFQFYFINFIFLILYLIVNLILLIFDMFITNFQLYIEVMGNLLEG